MRSPPSWEPRTVKTVLSRETYDEVKKCVESFVYGVNTPSRWGTQAPFSNITLDWVVPADLAQQPAIIGGQPQDFTYGDCQKEMDLVNKAFIEVMIEGDANGRGFQYPIPTYSITKDFDWSDTENNKLLFEMTSKYGTPYFSNYVNSDMQPSDVRSMCCRLRLDLRELRRKSGGFFGSGESTGSVGVVTINLPRIAYLAKDKDDFYARLDRLMDISARSLKVKRQIITKLLNEGLYPYTKRYGALSRIAFPRRDTSQPISESSFSSASKSAGFCSSARSPLKKQEKARSLYRF